MIKRFLYVEDGSVDIDSLQEELAADTKIIVYRKGSVQPILVELKEPAGSIFDRLEAEHEEENTTLKYLLDKLTNGADEETMQEVVAEYSDKFC